MVKIIYLNLCWRETSLRFVAAVSKGLTSVMPFCFFDSFFDSGKIYMQSYRFAQNVLVDNSLVTCQEFIE